jgi:uncharacterized protein
MTSTAAPFVLGLAGSLHCVSMCGPLLLALPFDTATRMRMTGQALVYHLGRVLTYMIMGGLVGYVGQFIALAGMQKGLSVVAGGLMITMAILSWRVEWLATQLPGMNRFHNFIKRSINTLLRYNHPAATLSLGMLNGFLPCGMVYAALAGAISTSTPLEGGLFMALFGFGTLPLLLVLMLAGRSAPKSWRAAMTRWQHALFLIVGILLIIRGLHLDLSLFRSAVPPADFDCH